MTLSAAKTLDGPGAAPNGALRLRGGSVVGRRHLLEQRNCQDALVLGRGSPGLFVAALADGCSEGRASEVGAQLATRFAVRWIERSWRALRHCASTEIARLLERALLSYLEAVFEPLSTEESRALLIRDMGLFTLFVLIADEDRTVVLGLGDGLVADIHQVRRFLPSRPDQPDYVAYRLLPNLAGPARLSAVYEESTDRVSGLLVATDGLFSLSDAEILTLIRQQASASNPLALERQLRVFAHRKRRLQDDATAILLDREGGSPCV